MLLFLGFGAGVRRSVMNLGLILGPLWSGAMVETHLTAMLGVNLSLVLLAAALFFFSFGRMKATPQETPENNNSINA